MRPTFLHFPVNGIFDDPIVYVQFIDEKRALLFDAGDFGGLNHRKINRLTHLFVTHTHIDHFIGFDRILRLLLGREKPLKVYGPEGITDAVLGKLRGYTWNLIEGYPLTLEVAEVAGDSIAVTELSARRSFRETPLYEGPLTGDVIVEENSFRVRCRILDHGVPVLGFVLEEPYHINIDKEALRRLELPVGPWLSHLKTLIRQGEYEAVVEVSGGSYRVSELLEVVRITRGQKLGYVMDAAPTEENIQRIVDLCRNSDVLYIESYFVEEDRQRALERRHLTASVAGEIGAMACVREIRPLHVSPKYRDCPERVLKEVMDTFRTATARITSSGH